MPFPLLGLAAGAVSTAIVVGLASGAAQIALKVVASLGFGYLAFTGVDMLVTQNETQALSLLNELPPLARQLVGVLQIGTCIKIVFSALVLRVSIMGLNEGVIKRMQVIK